MRPVLALILAAAACAGELPADIVARVGATDITRAQLANELLRREGSTALLDWVQGHLDNLDWSVIADDAVVMTVAGHALRKRDLAAAMLRDKGARVREELVDIAMVEQAIAREGVVVDDALLASEFRMMERDFHKRLAASGQGYIDFASYIRSKQKMSPEQFLAQPAVRMLAAIHELVRRRLRAEWDDARLAAKLEAERERWNQRQGVDLSVIHLPWDRGAGGVVSDEERIRLQGVANLIQRQIAAKEVTFEKAWEAFGRSWDGGGPGGRVGWVDLDGRRADPKDRIIPQALVAKAVAFDGPLPALLSPTVHEAGVDLAILHGKRPARIVTLAEVRERLLQDELERQLEPRTKALMSELRAAAGIVYGSLPGSAKE